MPRRVSEVGEGTDDSNGVYGLIRDLLVEGKDARFVNRRGRYVLNWSRALDCYADYKARKHPHFKSKNLTRRKASNGLRSALLNFYKKEGAKEYKESKKVNDKDEVVERQFQMPSRVFESLFGNTVPSGESEQEDEQEINSIISEGEIDAEATPNSSDHGFDETMDLSCCDSLTSPNDLLTSPNVDGFKTEEDVSILSPDAAFHAQMFDTSAVDSALDEIICSDGISDEISEDMDLLGVLQDICPTSGSVKGGYRFYISLTVPLSEEVSSGMAEFDGVATVPVHKLNPFTLSGSVPSSDQPGDVPVTVTTQSGQRLGMTCFQYVDDMREMARQLVHDPAKQALWFAILCQEYGFFGTDSDVVQVLDPLNIEYQDSSIETKQQQSVKVLQLLVYTAAQTNAKQFIEMIFSTSAGRIVFDSYKDRTQLPEDVAKANGHNECAQYLQDLTKRLSKETECEDQPKTINWLELVKAVQNETSDSSVNENKQPGSSVANDDNTSDYFADAETSSLGSMEPDDACPSDSEEEDAANKGLKSTFGFSKPFSDDTSSNGRFLIGSASIHSPDEDFKKGLPPFDTGLLASLVSCVLVFFFLLFQDNASSEGRCHKEPKCLQDNNTRSSRRRYSGRKFKGILLAGALSVLVAVFMLGDMLGERFSPCGLFLLTAIIGSSANLYIGELEERFKSRVEIIRDLTEARLSVCTLDKRQTLCDLVCLWPGNTSSCIRHGDPLVDDHCRKNIKEAYFHKHKDGSAEFGFVSKYGWISSYGNITQSNITSSCTGAGFSSLDICTIMSTGKGSSASLNISELRQSFKFQCYFNATVVVSTAFMEGCLSVCTPDKRQKLHDLVCLWPGNTKDSSGCIRHGDPFLDDCCQKNLKEVYFHKHEDGSALFDFVTKYGPISTCGSFTQFNITSSFTGAGLSSQNICTIMSTGTDLSMRPWEVGSEYSQNTKLFGNFGVIGHKVTPLHLEAKNDVKISLLSSTFQASPSSSIPSYPSKDVRGSTLIPVIITAVSIEITFLIIWIFVRYTKKRYQRSSLIGLCLRKSFQQDFSVPDVCGPGMCVPDMCVPEQRLCFAKLPLEDASVTELEMERVRSWLSDNPDSEAFVSAPFADASKASAITEKRSCRI
ncbi:uncharacterized protein [Montipora foliosa]|uniref:uncharacterized protein n=1 Tax=Montipora foliosa TaxID=591990 RepID=UPI0035F10B36